MTTNDFAAIEAATRTAIADIQANSKKIDDFLKSQESINASRSEDSKISKDALAAANAAAANIDGLTKRLVDLEQQAADSVKQGNASVNSLGQLVLASDQFKNFKGGQSAKMSVEVQANTITGQEGSPARNSDTLVPAQRLPGIIPGAFRKLRLRDVLPSGQTASNAIEFTRELSFTNNAAETGEGDTKPQSAITFELKNSPVRTIAHWIKASKQILEDAPMLQGHIDGRLSYGVEYRIDSQILNGNGSGQNLDGLLKNANYTSFSPTAGDTALDSLNRMIEAIALGDYEATAIILNPRDWHAIERLKDTTDRYLIGNPTGIIQPILWGLPVIVTNAMPTGKAHVSDINLLGQYFERSGTVVEMFEQDDTNVQKNLLTIRAEARGALAVYLPAVSRYGALTSPGASA